MGAKIPISRKLPRTGRPIMAVLDLLGRRWTLRVLWELHMLPAGFRELQARCGGMSASVLNTRLGELRSAGITAANAAGDGQLTPLGEELVEVLGRLHQWSLKWEKLMKKARSSAK